VGQLVEEHGDDVAAPRLGQREPLSAQRIAYEEQRDRKA